MSNLVRNYRKLLYGFARSLLLATSAVVLTACGTLAEKMPWHDEDPVDYRLIATNLVDAISQYPRLNPLLATVQTTRPDNAFERQVHKEMVARGYKVESVGEGQGSNGVDANIRSMESDTSEVEALYVLTVGDTSVERRFNTTDGTTVPASELIVRGADERTVKLNDAELFSDVQSEYSQVVFGSGVDQDLEIADIFRPAAEKMRDSLPQGPLPPVVKRNVYDTMISNFSEIYEEYEDLEQSILIFPNDSLRLGETNKKIIEQFVDKMDKETDVLSVIGCSHGATQINNGNSLLALGRAHRVKEAFLFSGVDHDSVLDEGCWAPNTFDLLPNRGVVLTLKRRKSS